MPDKIFYVYEHWRPDTNSCFWVGKGKGKRAFVFKRSLHYNNIVKKLKKLGLEVEVKIIASGMSEADALYLECYRIAFWKLSGVGLANITRGGEGASGHKHSDETIKIIKEKRALQKVSHSEETRKKISEANITSPKSRRGKENPEHSKKMKGRKLTEEHKKSISDGNKGRIFTPETCAKISSALLGKTFPECRKKNISRSLVGTKQSDETKLKKGESLKKSWSDPDVRAKRLAKFEDPEWKSGWMEALRKKPPATEEHKRNLSEAGKASWARRKAAQNECN